MGLRCGGALRYIELLLAQDDTCGKSLRYAVGPTFACPPAHCVLPARAQAGGCGSPEGGAPPLGAQEEGGTDEASASVGDDDAEGAETLEQQQQEGLNPPSAADPAAASPRRRRDYVRWTSAEEQVFFGALRGVVGQKPEACIKIIVARLEGSKEYAQVGWGGVERVGGCAVHTLAAGGWGWRASHCAVLWLWRGPPVALKIFLLPRPPPPRTRYATTTTASSTA